MTAAAIAVIRPTSVESSCDKVEFRQKVLALEAEMRRMVDAGTLEQGDYPVKHYFTPRDITYGCYVYAREIFLPKGHVVIGKIHKRPHLSFLIKGKVFVVTEFGMKYFEAPCTFIAEAGVKRAGYVEEDTIWTTVHLTEHCGEENLAHIEDEVIAKTYEDIGLTAFPLDTPQIGGPT